MVGINIISLQGDLGMALAKGEDNVYLPKELRKRIQYDAGETLSTTNRFKNQPKILSTIFAWLNFVAITMCLEIPNAGK